MDNNNDKCKIVKVKSEKEGKKKREKVIDGEKYRGFCYFTQSTKSNP
jgi:hypothetical protein